MVQASISTGGKIPVSGERRRRRRGGNLLLEFGLVFTPLMAMMMAIVDYSMPVFLRATFVHAVREGVRYGITYQTMTGMSQTDSVKEVVKSNSMGFLSGATGPNYIQVKYYSPTTFAEVVGTGANSGGNIIEVSVNNYMWNQMLPIWRSASPLAINAISSDRLETLPRSTPLPTP